tara:strand:- start:675 stop:827 length:153 start_codon:yes stop_codon:yes gene_type:complete
LRNAIIIGSLDFTGITVILIGEIVLSKMKKSGFQLFFNSKKVTFSNAIGK